MSDSHWVRWHDPYQDPDSPLSARLRVVQLRIREVLDARRTGAIRVLSICAGQGHDLIGALDGHPRADDVEGVLIEIDEENVDHARRAAAFAGLSHLTVRLADAADTSSYLGAVPADLVLACGVLGNISNDDMARTIAALPMLCAADATVIWTRHRRAPDQTGPIRHLLADSGFVEQRFDAPDDFVFAVGTARFTGTPQALHAGIRLFDFVGDGARPA